MVIFVVVIFTVDLRHVIDANFRCSDATFVFVDDHRRTVGNLRKCAWSIAVPTSGTVPLRGCQQSKIELKSR